LSDLRPIYLARLDKVRPVVLLTRQTVMPQLRYITVAPITSRIRGLSVEVGLGRHNGLDHDCVVNCDNVSTIKQDQLMRPIGFLLAAQEQALTLALLAAFDLPSPVTP
jgi:mRNA interferase MazF